MKAEHRKELETNALADRMGRMVQTLKTGQQKKKTVLLVIGGLFVLGVLWFIMRKVQLGREENAAQWMMIGDGDNRVALANQETKNMQSKVARFQLAKLYLWDLGLKGLLSVDPKERVAAKTHIERAEGYYQDLETECKGDPVLEPEARYALAVIEETQAVFRPTPLVRSGALDKAQAMFKDLAEKFPESACGKAAKTRAELLEGKSAEKGPRQQIEELYEELHARWRPPPEVKLPDLPKPPVKK